MTIVSYFNPLDIQHVRAWKTLAEVGAAQKLTDAECKSVFATALKLMTISVNWPRDWSYQICVKMADQWIAELEHAHERVEAKRRWVVGDRLTPLGRRA